MRESWRQWRDCLRHPSWVVLICMGLCSLGGLWTEGLLAPGSETWWQWMYQLGLSQEGLLNGQFWTPLTFPWFHGSWLHLLTNCLLILLLGQRLFRLVGNKILSTIALLGIVVGGAFQLLVSQWGPSYLLIGASPIPFAWGMAWMALDPGARVFGLCFARLAPALLLVLAATVLIDATGSLGFALPMQEAKISHASHLGAGLIGWLWAHWWMARKPITRDQLREQRRSRDGQ